MTRLCSEDIKDIVNSLTEYDQDLLLKTGKTLKEIASRAAGRTSSFAVGGKFKAAVVPLTCGKGVIEGFSRTVSGIIAFLGGEVILPEGTDAKGLALAVKEGADLVFQADDDHFVAVNFRTGKTSDNSEATGRGFATAFTYLCGGLDGKRVLLVGAGQVGRSAALLMAGQGARLMVYDPEPSAGIRLAEMVRKQTGSQVEVANDLEQALLRHQLLFDASPAAGFIKERHLSPKTLIAAPGFPLGIAPECRGSVEERVIHDPLQLGVATMLFDVCS